MSKARSTNIEISIGNLADLCRISLRTAQQMAADGTFIRLSRGAYDRDASVGNYIDKLRDAAAGRGAGTGEHDLVRERAALAREQREAQAMKNAAARRELISADEAEREWASYLVALRARMLAVPTEVLQVLSHLTKHEIAVLDRTLRDAMDDASHVEAELDLADPAGSAPLSPTTAPASVAMDRG